LNGAGSFGPPKLLALKLYAAAGGDPIYCFDPSSKKLTRVDLNHAQ